MRELAVVLMLVSSAAYAESEVSFGTPIVKGSLDAKVVEGTVRLSTATRSAVLACADQATLAAPATAQVTLAIAADGKLSTSATGSRDAALDTCIASAFSTLAFDKPKDGNPVQAVVPVTVSRKAKVPADAGKPIENRLEGNGTIGLGKLGTIGGMGTGSGYGVGSGGSPRRPYQRPLVTIGQPKVKGDLDKAIIRRYIKRNIQKLVYCYEKELLDQPKLKGTLTATFVIGTDGNVSSSAATGLEKGPEVERCYKSVIQAIQFPKPKSGEVTVVYAFKLSPR